MREFLRAARALVLLFRWDSEAAKNWLVIRQDKRIIIIAVGKKCESQIDSLHSVLFEFHRDAVCIIERLVSRKWLTHAVLASRTNYVAISEERIISEQRKGAQLNASLLFSLIRFDASKPLPFAAPWPFCCIFRTIFLYLVFMSSKPHRRRPVCS